MGCVEAVNAHGSGRGERHSLKCSRRRARGAPGCAPLFLCLPLALGVPRHACVRHHKRGRARRWDAQRVHRLRREELADG
eukprot:scaffold19706_cov29-Tisochrysis_lutea.AAC.2